jgi:2',3'-cyclic-nucleotide 2'-phosphodiesterase/3'-nucleotidase/5'-nucleotidase
MYTIVTNKTRLTAAIIACAIFIGTLFSYPLQTDARTRIQFSDVPRSSNVYEAASYFADAGKIKRKANGTLGVNDKLTRKAALDLLHSVIPVYSSAQKKNNLTTYANALLKDGANKPLTREQAAKLMHFASNLAGAKKQVVTDVSDVNPFAPFVRSTLSSGMLSLDAKKRFLPKAEITRGEWLRAMYRAETITFPVTIMHTNDTHGNIQEFARRATAIENIRAKRTNTLLLDAGDVFTGTLYFSKYQGLKDAELMNMVGYDAMALGNHEFDISSAVLANFMKAAKFSIVSANLDLSKDPDFKSAIGKFSPYVVKQLNGFKVGIIGLTTETFRETSSPSEYIGIFSAIESTKKSVVALQNQGVDKIIVLSHLGLYEDMELAEQVAGVDVIVGGHTHDKLDSALLIGNTAIVQAGQYGQHLGVLDVAFDRKGNIVPAQINGRLIVLNPDSKVEGEAGEVAAHPAVKAIVDKATAEIAEYRNVEVGMANVALDGVRANVRTKETNLGNFIADSYLAYGKKLKNAQVALVNGGGIRESIAQGKITLGNVLTVMPFGNTMGVLDITGSQFKEAIENGVSNVEKTDGRFPQIAGARYTFDKSKPAKQRVVTLEVKDLNGDFVAVDPKQTYRIVTNSFVMKGGDGYDMFNFASYREDLGVVDYEMFVEYLKTNNPVSAQVEGRIKEVVAP